MINVLGKLPKKMYIACSGGVDSMAVVDFCSKHREVDLLFFHHGTKTSDIALEFLSQYSFDKRLKLYARRIEREKAKDESPEEFWRKERYKFFDDYNDKPIIMGHHLNDQMETWVFNSINGTENALIPYQRGNFLRPFILTPKRELVKWCETNNVPWVEDLSNTDCKYARNRIRNVILPEIQKINPGFETVVKKHLHKKYTNIIKGT